MAHQRESVFISKLNQKVYVNKLSISDEERIEERVGLGALEKAFAMLDPKHDFNIILSVFWDMIDTDDKKKILKHDFTYFVGTKEHKLDVSSADPVDILKALISGKDELLDIAKAMTQTWIKSQPDIKETDKKKVKEA